MVRRAPTNTEGRRRRCTRDRQDRGVTRGPSRIAPSQRRLRSGAVAVVSGGIVSTAWSMSIAAFLVTQSRNGRYQGLEQRSIERQSHLTSSHFKADVDGRVNSFGDVPTARSSSTPGPPFLGAWRVTRTRVPSPTPSSTGGRMLRVGGRGPALFLPVGTTPDVDTIAILQLRAAVRGPGPQRTTSPRSQHPHRHRAGERWLPSAATLATTTVWWRTSSTTSSPALWPRPPSMLGVERDQRDETAP